MITNKNNKNTNWEIGSQVNIGFMKNLTVLSVRSEKDGMPDIYTLENQKGVRYEFIPHNGIHKI
jgi:hypothetical protein